MVTWFCFQPHFGHRALLAPFPIYPEKPTRQKEINHTFNFTKNSLRRNGPVLFFEGYPFWGWSQGNPKGNRFASFWDSPIPFIKPGATPAPSKWTPVEVEVRAWDWYCSPRCRKNMTQFRKGVDLLRGFGFGTDSSATDSGARKAPEKTNQLGAVFLVELFAQGGLL